MLNLGEFAHHDWSGVPMTQRAGESYRAGTIAIASILTRQAKRRLLPRARKTENQLVPLPQRPIEHVLVQALHLPLDMKRPADRAPSQKGRCRW
jgi:hypothetical protein